MPVHKVRKTNPETGRVQVGYQWGHHGKVYFGAGAMKKAAKQGQAAHAAGWRSK